MSAIMRSGASPNRPNGPTGAFMRSGATRQYRKHTEPMPKHGAVTSSEVTLSPITLGKLRKAGYETLDELPSTMEELIAIDGVGWKTAEKIMMIKNA